MPAIDTVFTVARVAQMLGETEDLLYELSEELDPEDGCLWVYDLTEEGSLAFTQLGIENLRICLEERKSRP